MLTTDVYLGMMLCIVEALPDTSLPTKQTRDQWVPFWQEQISSPCLVSQSSRSPRQPFAPSFTQPAEQSSHRMPPSVFMHSRSSWQPPFCSAHSSTSAYANKPTTRLCVPDNNTTSQSQQKSKINDMIANGAYFQTPKPHVKYIYIQSLQATNTKPSHKLRGQYLDMPCCCRSTGSLLYSWHTSTLGEWCTPPPF